MTAERPFNITKRPLEHYWSDREGRPGEALREAAEFAVDRMARFLWDGDTNDGGDDDILVAAHDKLRAALAAPVAGGLDRAEAVARAPRLSDLRDAICFVERHDHPESSYCNAGRAQAHRIREALIARWSYQAAAGHPVAEEGRTWPSRDEFSRMTTAEVNAFLESHGFTQRVASQPVAEEEG